MRYLGIQDNEVVNVLLTDIGENHLERELGYRMIIFSIYV